MRAAHHQPLQTRKSTRQAKMPRGSLGRELPWVRKYQPKASGCLGGEHLGRGLYEQVARPWRHIHSDTALSGASRERPISVLRLYLGVRRGSTFGPERGCWPAGKANDSRTRRRAAKPGRLGACRLGRGRHVVEDHLEQPAGAQDVLVCERPRALGAPRLDRRHDRVVLLGVLPVGVVEASYRPRPLTAFGSKGLATRTRRFARKRHRPRASERASRTVPRGRSECWAPRNRLEGPVIVRPLAGLGVLDARAPQRAVRFQREAVDVRPDRDRCLTVHLSQETR